MSATDLREAVLRSHCAANDLARDACDSLLAELARLRGEAPGASGPPRCPECHEIFGGDVARLGLAAVVACGPEHVVACQGGAILVGAGAHWYVDHPAVPPPEAIP